MASYGQFCPVAKAMEILDERWTMLVLRELMSGSTRFNEVRRGVPKMSPALLSKRLRSLVRAGLVERTATGDYRLTPAGAELTDVVHGIGRWGLRWIPQLGEEDYDPHLLMWDMRRNVDLTAVPPGRTVLHFVFRDVSPEDRSWWLIITPDGVDLCMFDPGHPLTATVETDLRTLTHVWRGELTWSQAQRSGTLQVRGPAYVGRSLPRWLPKPAITVTPRSA
jgi:DNA-binding HxlR family transcriptional regulator